jgi:hypothetical protein
VPGRRKLLICSNFVIANVGGWENPLAEVRVALVLSVAATDEDMHRQDAE